MAKYSRTSPYFNTPQSSEALGYFVPRNITSEDDDRSYTIEKTYAYRPDLLAFDLYGSPRYGGCSPREIQTRSKIQYMISNQE